MTSYIKTSVAAAATLLCMGAAQAGVIRHVINFEEPVSASLFAHGDQFYQAGFRIDTESSSATPRPTDLVGALIDGSDTSSCAFRCPTNNRTNYYASLDDSLVSLTHQDGLSFTLDGFDAAFLGDPTGLGALVAGRIVFQGVNAATGELSGFVFNLSASGQFSSYTTTATGFLRNTPWSQMFIYSQYCLPDFTCHSFNNNRAQFGLDNVRLNVIPEPTSLALVAAALLGLGAARRRRQA